MRVRLSEHAFSLMERLLANFDDHAASRNLRLSRRLVRYE